MSKEIFLVNGAEEQSHGMVSWLVVADCGVFGKKGRMVCI
jgi:hypothetical protein